MRRILALLALICGSAYAQDDVTVAGRALDAATGSPVQFATVTVLRDGMPVGGELADEEGRFVIEGLERGSYTVSVGFVGYTAAEAPLLIGERNDNYDLGDLTLARAEGVTDEVIVTAQRQILEANLDRRVFDLGSDIARATGSVLDAMRGLPGVTVTQEGQIQLRGSDRVAILIDGKQSGLTGIGNQSGLDSIPAGSIASIEVINNPSAAYDANGMAGVINIVYRQDQAEGLQLDTGLSLGVGALDKRKPDLPTELGSFSSNWKINPRVNLVNNSDRGGYFVQADVLFQEDLPNNEFTTRYYDDGRVTLSQVPENREQEQVVVRGGFDREIDDYRSWTFSSLFDFEHHTDVAQVPYIDARGARAVPLLVLARRGEDGAPEPRAHAHARVRAARQGAELERAVHARLGRRGVLPERPFGAAQRAGRDAPRRARAHVAVPARLREAAAQRPHGDGLQAAAPRDTRRLPRQPRRGHGHLSRASATGRSGARISTRATSTTCASSRSTPSKSASAPSKRTCATTCRPRTSTTARATPTTTSSRCRTFASRTTSAPRPACHLLQQSRRSPRRTRAADLPEVRRPRDLEGRQSVLAAAVHGALRARLRAGLGTRERRSSRCTGATSTIRSCACSRSTTAIPTTTS